MPSENPISADNQQGRLDPQWSTGFVDGEGCFSISIFKNNTSRLGYQVFPEFVIAQGAKSIEVLVAIEKHFQCGKIYENKRNDNHRESLYRYCVRSSQDIREKIIPFFQKHPLQTAKRFDFEIFCEVVKMIEQKQHLTDEGFAKIRTMVANMNRKKERI